MWKNPYIGGGGGDIFKGKYFFLQSCSESCKKLKKLAYIFPHWRGWGLRSVKFSTLFFYFVPFPNMASGFSIQSYTVGEHGKFQLCY